MTNTNTTTEIYVEFLNNHFGWERWNKFVSYKLRRLALTEMRQAQSDHRGTMFRVVKIVRTVVT